MRQTRVGKRPFTLVEMTIALALFGIICGLFFSLFYSFAASSQHLKKKYAKNEEIELCHVKLKTLFNGAIYTKNNPSSCFFLKRDRANPSLYFSTTNGVDPDPLFSSTVLAGLTLDPMQRLILTLWPDVERLQREKLQDKPPQRSLCLLENVVSIQYRFLTPLFPLDKIPQGVTPTEFSLDWPKELEMLPAGVEITVEVREEQSHKTTCYTLSYLVPEVLKNMQIQNI